MADLDNSPTTMPLSKLSINATQSNVLIMNKGMQFVLHVERRVTLGRRLLFILEPSEILFTYALTGQLNTF